MSRVLWFVFGLGAIAAFLLFGYASGADDSAMTGVSAMPAESLEVSDRITHPPIRQAFEAAPYELLVSAVDDWRTSRAHIQLYKDTALLWQKELPHEYGPRFVLVSAQGQVALFDEYINVGSPYAITLLDASGTEVAQYNFDDIKQVLADVAPSNITGQAFSGLWISANPVLNPALNPESNGTAFRRNHDASPDNRALVETGGTTLELNMTTGQLRRRDDL